MPGRLSRWLAPVPLLAALSAPGSALAAPPSDGRGWLGEELPLPLAVRTAQDLAVKAAAEKQYLIFNLIAGGKLAWDQGDFATAAGSGRRCCACTVSIREIEKVIRPLAKEARARAGGAASTPPPAATTTPESAPRRSRPPAKKPSAAALLRCRR